MNYDKIKLFIIGNKKKLILYGVFVSFVLVSFVFLRTRKEITDKVFSSPSPTSVSKTSNSDNSITKNDDRAYYLNQVVTNNSPVTGLSWRGDKNIYSTDKGIFEAGTNISVVDDDITDIRWSTSFNALVKTNNRWSKLNYELKRLDLIPVLLNNPILSSNNKRIGDIVKNSLYVYQTDDYSKVETKFNEPIIKVIISDTTDELIVFTSYAKKTYIYRLNNKLEIKSTFEAGDDYLPLSVSTDNKTIILSLNNNLYSYDFNKLNQIKSFREKSRLSSSFKNPNEFVVIEKYSDNLGRELDNIYIGKINGKIEKISDSNSVINRLVINLPIIFNDSGSIATFIEKKGKTWILSLKSNLYPTYSESGELVFSNIKPQSH